MDVRTKVKAPEGVMAAEVEGQAVFMHVERGICYGLNEVGALVWRRMESPVRLEELREAVLQEFDVAPDVCERDLIALVEQRESVGLVEIIAPDA